MKTLSIYVLIVLVCIGVVSCNSAPGSSAAPDNYSSYYPYLYGGSTTSTTTTTNFTSGATATLTIDGSDLASRNQLMSQYTKRSMNDPQNIQINVNLSKTSGGSGYGGTVSIRYQDNGQTYQGTFAATQSVNDTQYNIWFNSSGRTVFHGFFEDSMGAIIIVFDGIYNLGDGSPAFGGGSTGSVYFMNFGQTYAPHPPSHCWLVSIGPYDCRAWKWGDGVATTYAIYPESYYYTRLGTFSAMNLYQAFNASSLP